MDQLVAPEAELQEQEQIEVAIVMPQERVVVLPVNLNVKIEFAPPPVLEQTGIDKVIKFTDVERNEIYVVRLSEHAAAEIGKQLQRPRVDVAPSNALEQLPRMDIPKSRRRR